MRETFWQRLVRGVRRSFADPEWVQLLGEHWTDDIMQTAATDDFHAKQGRSTCRWVIERSGQRLAVYLKRHYRLPWRHGLLAALWPWRAWSPALQERHHLQWAAEQGLAVPRVLAAVEYVGPWYRLQSCLAIEELYDMLPLHQAIPLAAERLAPRDFQRWKRGLIAELARLTRELHRRKHYHKDLYLCHFYLPCADIAAELVRGGTVPDFRDRLHMIDLHRLAHHRWTWPVWLAKDLAELLFSSELASITPRDRLRFWSQYREGRPRNWLVRGLEGWIRLKWWRYRDHNQKLERKRQLLSAKQNRVAA